MGFGGGRGGERRERPLHTPAPGRTPPTPAGRDRGVARTSEVVSETGDGGPEGDDAEEEGPEEGDGELETSAGSSGGKLQRETLAHVDGAGTSQMMLRCVVQKAN